MTDRYETFGDPSSPALLLIMGIASQLNYWQDEFCSMGNWKAITISSKEIKYANFKNS
jgi:hypothetical protein